jgi:hypothetical protein
MNDEEKMVDLSEDTSVMNSQTSTALICKQYICYSATFQVPVFYFTLSHQGMSFYQKTNKLGLTRINRWITSTFTRCCEVTLAKSGQSWSSRDDVFRTYSNTVFLPFTVTGRSSHSWDTLLVPPSM